MTKTLSSIRGYMPTVAHWGWNGCARRYWDFLYGGKLARVERMIHHYGSGLNALPMLDSFKYNPQPNSLAALHDLRIGYGGHMGPLTNINAAGFGAQAFHSWPDTMAWEAYSGDYGPNFLGHILGATTYLVDHPQFGWTSMGGNLHQTGGSIVVQPRDTVRRSIYVSSMGLSLAVNAGVISSFTYNPSSKQLTVQLQRNTGQAAKTAILQFVDTLGTGVKFTSKPGPMQVGGGYKVALPSTLTFGF